MVSVWNSALKLKDIEVEGEKPLLTVFQEIETNNMRDDLLLKSGELNQNHDYDFDPMIVIKCWGWLVLWTLIYIALTILLLESIDRDKR